MDITLSGQTLGARITGIDLGQPLSDAAFRDMLRALGAHGVLCFPRQTLTPDQLAAFGRRFGELEINVANAYHEPDHPEMMILSNIRQNGTPIGANDAGQGWHTDMSYSHDIALANILHAQHVPMRNGKPLGETQFRNMHAAYDDLPDELKHRLEGRHGDARLRQVLGHDGGEARLDAEASDGGAAREEAAGVAADFPAASDHRTVCAVCQCRLHDVHRWDGSAGERADPRLPVPPPGARRLSVRTSLGGGRRADVGQYRHRAQRRWRLHADEPRYMRRVQVMATLDYPALVA